VLRGAARVELPNYKNPGPYAGPTFRKWIRPGDDRPARTAEGNASCTATRSPSRPFVREAGAGSDRASRARRKTPGAKYTLVEAPGALEESRSRPADHYAFTDDAATVPAMFLTRIAGECSSRSVEIPGLIRGTAGREDSRSARGAGARCSALLRNVRDAVIVYLPCVTAKPRAARRARENRFPPRGYGARVLWVGGVSRPGGIIHLAVLVVAAPNRPDAGTTPFATRTLRRRARSPVPTPRALDAFSATILLGLDGQEFGAFVRAFHLRECGDPVATLHPGTTTGCS